MLRIISDRLILRQLTLIDIDPIFEAARASVHEMKLWLPWCHENYKKEETNTWVLSQIDMWKEYKEFSFAIYERQTDELLGGVGLNEVNKSFLFGNLGYWIRTDKTGKGYATESALMCSKFGFDELKLRRIEIVMDPENPASRKVAEKLNATFECIARNRLFIHNQSRNACIFSLTDKDLEWFKNDYNISEI